MTSIEKLENELKNVITLTEKVKNIESKSQINIKNTIIKYINIYLIFNEVKYIFTKVLYFTLQSFNILFPFFKTLQIMLR